MVITKKSQNGRWGLCLEVPECGAEQVYGVYGEQVWVGYVPVHKGRVSGVHVYTLVPGDGITVLGNDLRAVGGETVKNIGLQGGDYVSLLCLPTNGGVYKSYGYKGRSSRHIRVEPDGSTRELNPLEALEVSSNKEPTGPILNLTQHPASTAQVEAGVKEPLYKDAIQAELTFETLPSRTEIDLRVSKLFAFATDQNSASKRVMIGGALFLMEPLTRAFRRAGWQVLFAFSQRESHEVTEPDGSVRKVAEFRHKGFVEA